MQQHLVAGGLDHAHDLAQPPIVMLLVDEAAHAHLLVQEARGGEELELQAVGAHRVALGDGLGAVLDFEECVGAIRWWKTRIRKEPCHQLLGKADHNLLQAPLRPLWKDVLLIPRDWYSEPQDTSLCWWHQPRYETQGWWYVPAEEVLGKVCKSCNAFCEIADFARAKLRREVLVRCYKCQLEIDRTSISSGREQKKDASRKRAAVTFEESTPKLRKDKRARACGLSRELLGTRHSK
jgi:hypothetical protein